LAVSNGLADAAIGNLATLEYSINNNWLSNLKSIKLVNEKNLPNSTPLYMGVKKGNTTLKSLLEKAHILLPHSKVLALKEKWLNMDSKHTVKINDEEYHYLENKKQLIMCINPNWMPFEKIENNQHKGMTSEYINIFQETLHMPIKLMKTNNWEDTLQHAKNKKCDFITAMIQTKEDQKYFILLSLYYQCHLFLLQK